MCFPADRHQEIQALSITVKQIESANKLRSLQMDASPVLSVQLKMQPGHHLDCSLVKRYAEHPVKLCLDS